MSAQSQTYPLAPPPVATASSEPLTLSEAVEIALAKNPLMRATAAGRALADAQLSAARATCMPIFTASEFVTTSNNPVFVLARSWNKEGLGQTIF